MHKINLAAQVTILLSGQSGTVVSRSESTFHAAQYLVRHKSAQGDHSEAWFIEEDLEPGRDVIAEILPNVIDARRTNGTFDLSTLTANRVISTEETRALLVTLGIDKHGVPL